LGRHVPPRQKLPPAHSVSSVQPPRHEVPEQAFGVQSIVDTAGQVTAMPSQLAARVTSFGLEQL
jgi:hypothetical protein